MPPMLKNIYKHNKITCERCKINLILIDDKNVRDYIDVHERFSTLAYNFKSDIIRYNVLNTYGGFWFDCDVIIIKNLHFLMNKLNQYECMLDVEISRGDIGCASLYMKKNSESSRFCVQYINRILSSGKSLNWGDIGPITATMLYKELPNKIKLKRYNESKKDVTLLVGQEDPGINKKNWLFSDSTLAKKRYIDELQKNENCFYIITWTIYRKHDMGNEIIDTVFNNPKSVFFYAVRNTQYLQPRLTAKINTKKDILNMHH